ncbi:hypothetical protein Pcinc_022176 [Petrolisthes cinctipes]|uniref:Uncharacterized protein n=1 Tax=Petrolisthes cinctipes TaxID=88211 RepID=A0AAE1KHG1_PETCI|nr:hypothetical protein Pcinc_022176 [Petrolisthes cinctipes]
MSAHVLAEVARGYRSASINVATAGENTTDILPLGNIRPPIDFSVYYYGEQQQQTRHVEVVVAAVISTGKGGYYGRWSWVATGESTQRLAAAAAAASAACVLSPQKRPIDLTLHTTSTTTTPVTPTTTPATPAPITSTTISTPTPASITDTNDDQPSRMRQWQQSPRGGSCVRGCWTIWSWWGPVVPPEPPLSNPRSSSDVTLLTTIKTSHCR